MSQVLHLDFVSLDPGAGPDQRRRLEEAAAGLISIPGVIGAGVIQADSPSEFDIAFWFLLPEFTALEPFGTDPRYSRFLQGNVAPVLRGFAGADVTLGTEFESIDGPAACLALMGPDEAYDFEVRETLTAWAEGLGPDRTAIGLAVGEKQMYRGAGLAFGGDAATAATPDAGPFRATLISGQARSLD